MNSLRKYSYSWRRSLGSHGDDNLVSKLAIRAAQSRRYAITQFKCFTLPEKPEYLRLIPCYLRENFKYGGHLRMSETSCPNLQKTHYIIFNDDQGIDSCSFGVSYEACKCILWALYRFLWM